MSKRMKDLEKQRTELLDKIADIDDSLEIMVEFEDELPAKSDITDEQKIQVFDELYDACLGRVRYAVEHGHTKKDSEYYLYEQAMTQILGHTAIDIINSVV